MCELERYDIVVGALQEMKWFGCEVYEVNGSVVLTSGRTTPAQGGTSSERRGSGTSVERAGS